jgi:subtilase family protein
VLSGDGPERKLAIERQHGTSFAAPIVSFVAALLKSEGLRAADIKRRLVLSAYHEPTIPARFGARLDIETALALYNDVIFLRSTTETGRLRGKLNRRQALDLPEACGGSREVRHIFRIERVSRNEIGQTSRFRFFLPVQRGSRVKYENPNVCDIDDEHAPILTFYDVDTLETRDISLKDIQRVVMRERN